LGELELIRAHERGLTPHQRRKAIKRRDSGAETLAEIGRSYNVGAAALTR